MRSLGRVPYEADKWGESHIERRGTPRDLRWALVILLVSSGALWRAWKVMNPLAGLRPGDTRQPAGCLSNLEQIGRGFALYASDWNGKFPRGKDAEDRVAPQIWQKHDSESESFSQAVAAEPMLPDLLQSYQVPQQAWHCPADVGWDTLQDADVGPLSLHNVHPSAWQKYGMSYSYLTMFGLRGLKAGDLNKNADNTVLLFDNNFWHRATEGGEHQAGTLFADGSARMSVPSELGRLVNQDSPLNSP